MARRAVGFGLGILAAVAGTQACQSLQVAHSGDNPRYELVGKHLTTPCESCHGEGRPEAQSRICFDCHETDVPNAQHFPGQECGSCHTPLGWDVVATTVPPTDDTGPDTTDTGDTDLPTPGWVHDPVGPTELCWTCHDVDREEDHWWSLDITFRWDCGPCHTLVTWNDDPRTPEVDTAVTTYEHQARTPHGTRNDQLPTSPVNWVVDCTTCHPSGSYAQFDCVNCHLERTPTLFPHYNASNADCLGCHRTGDSIVSGTQ